MRLTFAATLLLAGALGLPHPTESQTAEGSVPVTEDLLSAMAFRTLGPGFVSGRIQDIAIDPNDSNIWYVASAFGGLWKTVNRGITFEPIFDMKGVAHTLGVVVVDPNDSNVVWLGTGENKSQRSAHFGTGLYKSTDGGDTWERVGLEKSEHIGMITLDPRDSNVVYVAAQGPLFAPGGDRGLFKTTDGGKTWTNLLQISEDTGMNEVHLDPADPDIVYASTYQRRRHVGQLVGGGPESGIYKSTDGGATWRELTNGLPDTDMGRIAMAMDTRGDTPTLLALIPAQNDLSGLYRSTDQGESWERFGRQQAGGGAGAGGASGARGAGGAAAAAFQGMDPAAMAAAVAAARGGDTGALVAALTAARIGDSAAVAAVVEAARSGDMGAVAAAVAAARGESPQAQEAPEPRWFIGGNPEYYHELILDPHRPGTIYSINTYMDVSTDWGETWGRAGWERTGVHVDHHALAFNPHDPPHRPGQRRRALRELRRGRHLEVFRQPPGDPVLPPLRGQRPALLQRVRRNPGQLLLLRALPDIQTLGRPKQRLVHRSRWGRLPVPERPRRPRHRLRHLPERWHQSPGPQDGAVGLHPTQGSLSR
jgi:photosystem II stability/assembly factor-like uncharacterized protein